MLHKTAGSHSSYVANLAYYLHLSAVVIQSYAMVLLI